LSINLFLVAFAAGAAAVAWWVDARFPTLAPESMRLALIHVGISIVVGQLLVPAVIKTTTGTGLPELIFVVIVGVGLPALVYCFLSALWIMKLLAGQLRGFPR